MKKIVPVVITIAMIFTIFPGCSPKQKNSTLSEDRLLLSAAAPPSLDGFLSSPPALIGKPGVDFQLLKTGEANDWGDMPAPKINPLGSKSLYNNTSYYQKDHCDMVYLEGVSEISHSMNGELWRLSIDDKNLTLNYLRWYAEEIGATLYNNTDDRVTFSLTADDQLWWATASCNDPEDPQRTILHVLRQHILPIGKTITIKPADLVNNEYCFTTVAGSSDFVSFIVDIEGGERALAEIWGSNFTRTGFLLRDFHYYKRIEKSLSGRYALDNIPQTDEPVFWSVKFYSGNYEPESISIRFEKTGSITPVKISDRFGGLKVIGASGSATVFKQSALNRLEHVDGFSMAGIVDSDGNTVFHLPAGYYNVRANLPGGSGGGIRMVPVNGGELTEVILPDEFKSTYSSFESVYGSFTANMGSIAIQNNKDNGDTAEVSIMIDDPLKRDVFPEKENVTITEGGAKAEILDIKRQTAPVNVVLAIDTSGSMKDYMKPTIEAAKRFVASLPDRTNISLVSFAQVITEHKGSGKEAVLKTLDTLKAVGGTALYDATDIGLSMLNDQDNAFLVVFSDGADSRELKNQGKGSSLNRAQIIDKLKLSAATLLTIGFGEDHDPDALIAMSGANGKGAYFSANNEAGLDPAFAAVAGKFGNEFVIRYKRPEVLTDFKSQQPVVGVMVDDSGSMAPFRDGVIAAFHEFFSALPEGSLIQFSKFGDFVDMMHITTDQKAVLMQALGETGETGHDTAVIKALKAGVEQLRPLPTDKKVFVFVTDDAMSEVEWNKAEAGMVFKRFREEGIRCLFVGASNASNVESAYRYAAEMTGSEYVFSSDTTVIMKKLQELLEKVSVPLIEGNYLPFSIGINAKTDDGSVMDYFATKNLYGFAPKTIAGKTQELRTAKIVTGGKMVPLYDKKAAALIGAGTKPGNDELKVTSHVTYEKEAEQSQQPGPSSQTGSTSYGKSGKNSLAAMTVKDVYTFDVLGGVKANQNNQFLAVNLEIAFPAGSSQVEAYNIPSIFQHFYLSVNNGDPLPASKATWLAAEPISEPGVPEVRVKKGEKRSGVLVFYGVKPETIRQLALHFYDTSYGHIHIPLAGKIDGHLTDITELPKAAPTQITDAFSMTVTGKSDQKEYGSYKPDWTKPADSPEVRRYTVLRTLQAKFDSKVQALFNIDPKERFYYVLETAEGPLMTKINDIVWNIPLGFTGNTLLAPNISSTVHMPYEMPAALADVKSHLFGDINNGAFSLPVTGGSPYKTASQGIKFKHEYFDVTINALCRNPYHRDYLVLDISINDIKDGFGTTGLGRVFALFNSQEGDSSKQYIEAASNSGDYLYGIDSQWAVFDGQSRRGFLMFYAPDRKNDAYTLRSPYFKDMNVKVQSQDYAFPELLALNQKVEIRRDFEDSLDMAVASAITRYQSTRPKQESPSKVICTVDTGEGADVPAPSSAVLGDRALHTIDSLQDFYYTMYALSWLPAANQNEYYYAPEAVCTQGWGTEWDLVNLADNIMNRLGEKTTYREVAVTKRGKEALAYLCGMKEVKVSKLPALAYTDDDGQGRIFVIPFMRDISELSGLLYLPSSQQGNLPGPAKAVLTITANIIGAPDNKSAGQAGMFAAFSKAMDGGEESPKKVENKITLLSQSLSIPALSMDAIDIGYYAAAKSDGGGELIKAVASTVDGLLQGGNVIDTGSDEVKSIIIKMSYTGCPDGGYVHTTIPEEGQKLTDICHTLGFGLPEMTDNAVTMLMEESGKAAKTRADANSASKVKWFTRNALYRFVAAGTRYDNEIAKRLNLVMGRVNRPICLMITARTDGTNATASFDLMYHHNQILEGEENQANAYRLFRGIFASELEGHVFADGEGASFLNVWSELPSNANLFVIPDNNEARREHLDVMKGKYPEVLLSRIQNSIDKSNNTVFLVPTAAGKALGKPRWAWLEIDSRTYEAVSVFDTGEHGAEYVLGMIANKDVEAFVGAFIGVECATWAVTAYSLSLDDYDDILTNAKLLCAEVLTHLEEVMSLTGGPEDYVKSKVKDKIKEKLKDTGIKAKGKKVDLKRIENILKGKKFELSKGFVQGFKLAVEAYFVLE